LFGRKNNAFFVALFGRNNNAFVIGPGKEKPCPFWHRITAALYLHLVPPFPDLLLFGRKNNAFVSNIYPPGRCSILSPLTLASCSVMTLSC
jgi:hypothetical protein